MVPFLGSWRAHHQNENFSHGIRRFLLVVQRKVLLLKLISIGFKEIGECIVIRKILENASDGEALRATMYKQGII